MDLPIGVLVVYGALVVWAALLVTGWRRRSFGPFLGFGLLLGVALNVRYFIDGSTDSIAFFIGIYDVLDNLGLGSDETAAAMTTCADNACTVWGDRFTNHPSWGVAFYDRFANGSALRNNLLYGHILFNTIAFILLHVQLRRPGTGPGAAKHRRLGRLGFAAVTVGTGFGVLLAAEHGSVVEYGGNLAMVGFWFMSVCVYGCAIAGVRAIRRRDTASHRTWMIRYAGSMWGAFWLFRVMLFVLDPLLRNVEAAALLICIWFSAPLGIAIAEVARRRGFRLRRPLDAVVRPQEPTPVAT